MKPNCEYCGAALPEGVDKLSRRVRSSHFTRHALERRIASEAMTDKQPEALRLADSLDQIACLDPLAGETAAELRRLHALCDEMGEALQHAHHVIGHPDCEMSKARAELIAKRKGIEMSATQELIAAALTAADELDELSIPMHSRMSPHAAALREACARARARAMVQPAPDMAEVERLAAYWRDRVMAYATTSIDSRGQYLAYQVTETEARAALLDYVRGVMAERDALMLEFCPQEMTEVQKEKWARNQQPVSTAEVPMPEPDQFRDAAKMVPAAWQVWCGLGKMQPYWPVFRTKEEAEECAKTIKTYTEVRPLWSHASAAPQPVGEHGKSLARQPLTNPELDAWLDIHGPNGINSKKERS